MFEFEIGTNDYSYNSETKKSERLVLTGKAIGCIDDYLVRTITSDNEDGKNFVGETKWVKIGDTIVQLYKIQYIKVKAVSE